MGMIDNVNNIDFFASGEEDFYRKFSHRSILCQGKHWKKPPLVTILITTYKRPELLRQALESALNQKGFNDYQIIIADNEGRPIEEETPTAKVVKQYQYDKVIYYRHAEEVLYKADSAVLLARSKWIVFLHDDDILAENHLLKMTEVVKKHKEIKFLGCAAQNFSSESDIDKDANIRHCMIRKLHKNSICFRNWAGWLGALIRRKYYIAIGGMPAYSMGCGDKVMVGIFLHRYGTYICDTDRPLYYYRIGEQQISYTQRDSWENVLINEYCFERYVINNYHKVTHKIWERNLAHLTLQNCVRYNRGVYHTEIDLKNIMLKCNMPDDIREKNFQNYINSGIFWIYRKCVRYLNYINRQILRKSDIYLDVE